MSSIFISGASKGIGLALAQKFHHNGYTVGICARGEAALQQAAGTMPGLHTFVCDMADRDQVKALARDIEARMGCPDILVNNAGRFLPGAIHEEEEAVYDQMMRTNMDSAYFLTKGLLPTMKTRRYGQIVNIASIASLAAYANGGSYSISKYALLGFSKNLREELKPFGIRVISVMPGAVLTDSWSGYDGPTERLMSTEDVAELIWTCTNLSPRTVVEDIVLRPQLGDL